MFIGILVMAVSSFIKKRETPVYTTITELGAALFHEKMLSLDSSISCASCHQPDRAFADTVAFSKGIGGHLTKRNVPSVLNMKNRAYFFYDGRSPSLQHQALAPITHPDEMGMTIAATLERLNNNEQYRQSFLTVFKQEANADNLGKALAAFEQTLETINSQFDDWSNNIKPLSAAEERGREIFVSDKAKCFDCHFMEDFTDDEFKNIGLFDGRLLNDSGRMSITKDPADLGKFKTPGLRNVGVTAPYMHNGMFKTLEEVVDYYNDPRKVVKNPINIDPSLKEPLGLTTTEKKDLVAFLKSLTDKKYLHLLH